MKEVLLGVAGVRTEMLFRPSLEFRPLDALAVEVVEDALDPDVDGKGVPVSRPEEEGAVRDLVTDPVKSEELLARLG